jgi:hypothetical protein
MEKERLNGGMGREWQKAYFLRQENLYGWMDGWLWMKRRNG